MTRDLRYERSAYAMNNLKILRVPRIVERLKSAPLEVRRLGLPLAIAGWDRDGKPELVRLVAGWLYKEWGMLPPRPVVPQSAVALLQALAEDDVSSPMLRSAAEVEAEEVLQAAKLLAGAAQSGAGGTGEM